VHRLVGDGGEDQQVECSFDEIGTIRGHEALLSVFESRVSPFL
jgi:hypothetical protein